MMKNTYSMRFSDDEIALIDAAAAAIGHRNGTPMSRPDLVRFLLKRVEPSKTPGEQDRVWREAYAKVYA
jgi:hypothetical protein